jgi:hypothetical protein
VFAHFVQAEWDADWAEAGERCGDDASMADLRRTEPQRRADAMVLVGRCLWPGCDRRARNCQSDHSLECGAHNLFKERHGSTAHRQPDGEWIIRNTDGDPVN